MPLNVQYGCGLSAPDNWVNFDSSPTLRLQKLPVIGGLFKKVDFPPNVLYGDILRSLPGIDAGSCDAIYCSHVLEHLSFEDCKLALRKTFALLKSGGIFRCVLPDLEQAISRYLDDKRQEPSLAGIHFMQSTRLGFEKRPVGIKGKLISALGNSHHLWMWDQYSLKQVLIEAGFRQIRKCIFNDSADKSFLTVEEESRFWSAIAFESIK